jgi:hypothetical protein
VYRSNATRRSGGRNQPRWLTWTIDHGRRRLGPLVLTVVFVSLGSAYYFRWGPLVQHVPSTWLSAADLWSTYNASFAFIHGNFATVYSTGTGFLAFPGILIVFAPIAAIGSTLQTTLIEIAKNHHPVAHPEIYFLSGSFVPHATVVNFGKQQLAPHPQVFVLLAPYELLISAVALFALDALAEQVGVSRSRRIWLTIVQVVLLWNLAVRWGHPQDALAVAFVVYAMTFAIRQRWTGAGWLFGLALAFQPMVIVVLPLLLVAGGLRRVGGLLLRGLLPSIVVTIPPLAGDFHNTVHVLSTQPAYPARNHATPWTSFAPKIRVRGALPAVGGGPVRVLSLVLAAGFGWWARRWRSTPAMLAWATALALALRCYTESVMTDYYAWPALAVGLVVSGLCTQWRFLAVIATAVLTTVVAQWHLEEYLWWVLDMGGITVVLLLSARPGPVPESEAIGTQPQRGAARPRPASRPSTAKRQKSTGDKRKKARSRR